MVDGGLVSTRTENAGINAALCCVSRLALHLPRASRRLRANIAARVRLGADIEPRMLEDVVDVDAFPHVPIQTPHHQVPRLPTELRAGDGRVGRVENGFVVAERTVAGEEGAEKNAERPNVGHGSVVRLIGEDFWCGKTAGTDET